MIGFALMYIKLRKEDKSNKWETPLINYINNEKITYY